MAERLKAPVLKCPGFTNKQIKYISHNDMVKMIDIHYYKGMLPENMKNESIDAKIYKFQKKKSAECDIPPVMRMMYKNNYSSIFKANSY